MLDWTEILPKKNTLAYFGVTRNLKSVDTLAQWYKTFYGRNLLMFVISCGCLYEAFKPSNIE